MKLPRVRFTIRRLMVAVAVVAIAVYGSVLWRRSVEYRHRAEDALNLAKRLNDTRNAIEESIAALRGGNYRIALISRRDQLRREIDYWDAARIKYSRVALYPFLPVAPDPPEPE